MEASDIDIESIKEHMTKVAAPEIYRTATKIGIDLAGQTSRADNIRAILARISEMSSNEIKDKVTDPFREMAELVGAITTASKPIKKKEASVQTQEAKEPAKKVEPKKAAAKPAPAKKETKKVEAKKETKKAEKASEDNTEVTPVPLEDEGHVVPASTLIKLLDFMEDGTRRETAAGGKTMLQFHGYGYAKMQDACRGQEVVTIEGEGDMSINSWLKKHDAAKKLGQVPQQLAKAAKVFRAVVNEDKKTIPAEILERACKIGPSKLKEISPLPDIPDIILKGLPWEGKVVPLEDLTKAQIGKYVKSVLKAAGKSKPARGPGRSVRDLLSPVDDIEEMLTKVTASKGKFLEKFAGDKEMKKRLVRAREVSERAYNLLKEVCEEFK